MAFDPDLAQRVRAVLARRRGVNEKRMFGGLCFLVNGNMACGLIGDELMVRVGADDYAAALRRPHAREMRFTGRPLRGFVTVGAAGVRTAAGLRAWVERGRAFAASLPGKG